MKIYRQKINERKNKKYAALEINLAASKHSVNAFPKSFIIIVIPVNCECCQYVQYSRLFFVVSTAQKQNTFFIGFANCLLVSCLMFRSVRFKFVLLYLKLDVSGL